MDFCKRREQEGSAVLAVQWGMGQCQKSHRGTCWVCPHCAVSPGCDPGFIPVLLLSTWTLLTVVLEVPR